MNKTDRTSLIIFPVLIVVALLFALAGSQGGSTLGGMPLFGLLVGLAMGVLDFPSFRHLASNSHQQRSVARKEGRPQMGRSGRV